MADSRPKSRSRRGSAAKPAGETPAVPPSPENEGPTVVGIGASAGGLEALKLLLPSLPLNEEVVYIVAQHLDPLHSSMLTSLLIPSTRLEVREAVDGEVLSTGCVYIGPPAKNISLSSGRVCLTDPLPGQRSKPSVDFLFSSLAESVGDRAVGIVLSGTGTDSAEGVRAIKAGGGMTLVQDPMDAKFSGMPQAAILTGHVDRILPAAKIGPELTAMLSHVSEFDLGQAGAEELLQKIFRLLLQRTGVDFSDYKPNTVARRLARRMSVHRVHGLSDYLRVIERSPQEIDELFQDVLISVTAFFRDREAFQALEKLIEPVIQHKKPGEEFRVWVAGCASGEEAYSLAIMIDRLASAHGRNLQVQIFATDLDERAIDHARRGVYPVAALAEVDQRTLDHYFIPKESAYQLRKPIRDMVIFARHNVVRDPPFLRLDLISCRNLLIYFDTKLQQRVIPMFHYALAPGGLLFLGKSETIGDFGNLFAVRDRTWRLFSRKSVQANAQAMRGFLPSFAQTESGKKRPDASRGNPLESQIHFAMAQASGLSGVAVDENFRLLHVQGDMNRWLSLPQGTTDLDLIKMVRKELRLELRSLLRELIREGKPAHSRPRHLVFDDHGVILELSGHPLPPQDDGRSVYLLLFRETQAGTRKDEQDEELSSLDRTRVAELELELDATRQHLQTAVEELETSNEELQSLNEELQSTNEELQSTNEELQSSNEELQSTNEELTTVNEELLVKTAELVESHDALENVLSSIGNPLMVFDGKQRLVRYTGAAERVFDLTPSSLGQPLANLKAYFDLPHLREDIEGVMAAGKGVERLVDFNSGHFLQRVLPYISERDGITGALLVMQDQSRVFRTEHDLQEREAMLGALLENTAYGIVSIAEDGIVELFNPVAERLFGYRADEVIGQNVSLLMPEPERSEHDRYLGDYLAGGKPGMLGRSRNVEAQHKDGTVFPIVLTINEAWAGGRRFFVGLVAGTG